MKRFAPFSAYNSDNLKPIPELAPVIRQFFPFNVAFSNSPSVYFLECFSQPVLVEFLFP